MHIRKLLLAVALQASCAGESPSGPPATETKIPVLFAGTSAQACAATFQSPREHVTGGGTVTWALQSACGLRAGDKARVSMADWTFTDLAGNQVKGKHPFTSDCRLDGTLDGAGSAPITCTVAPDVQPGQYRYFTCIETGGQTVCRDPVLDYP